MTRRQIWHFHSQNNLIQYRCWHVINHCSSSPYTKTACAFWSWNSRPNQLSEVYNYMQSQTYTAWKTATASTPTILWVVDRMELHYVWCYWLGYFLPGLLQTGEKESKMDQQVLLTVKENTLYKCISILASENSLVGWLDEKWVGEIHKEIQVWIAGELMVIKSLYTFH